MGESIKLSATLFVFLHPIIYFFEKLVEVVNAQEWKSMEVKNLYWGSHQFWKIVFLIIGQVSTQKRHAHSIGHSRPSFPHLTEAYCAFLLHNFRCFPPFPIPKNRFLSCSVAKK